MKNDTPGKKLCENVWNEEWILDLYLANPANTEKSENSTTVHVTQKSNGVSIVLPVEMCPVKFSLPPKDELWISSSDAIVAWVV